MLSLGMMMRCNERGLDNMLWEWNNTDRIFWVFDNDEGNF